jgi:hypothetical protein
MLRFDRNSVADGHRRLSSECEAQLAGFGTRPLLGLSLLGQRLVVAPRATVSVLEAFVEGLALDQGKDVSVLHVNLHCGKFS